MNAHHNRVKPQIFPKESSRSSGMSMGMEMQQVQVTIPVQSSPKRMKRRVKKSPIAPPDYPEAIHQLRELGFRKK